MINPLLLSASSFPVYFGFLFTEAICFEPVLLLFFWFVWDFFFISFLFLNLVNLA